ncbi:MAG: TonB-dependent receptor domain-containing protein, partial [Flammeovirgaceae bacterium]
TGDPNLAHGEVNENSFQSYGVLVQHNQELGDKLTLRGGASIDVSPASYWANYIRIDRSDDGVYTGYEEFPDSVLTQYDVGLTNVAAYAQAEFLPIESLKLVAALRFDRFNYDYDNFLPETAFSGAPDEKNSFEALTPKLGLTYDLGKDKGVYANYSVGFVPPQVGELYRGVKVPVLKPATYYNYEVGGWIALPNQKGFFELSAYRMDGTNEIISVQLDDGSRENRNAGETRHQGIEYTLKYELVEGLKARISGTNARHEFIDYVDNGNDYSNNQMNRAPQFIGNAELSYYPTFIKGFRIALEWQHMGNYYMDEANTKEYGGFDVFNLRLGYRVKQVEAWLNIMNLEDEVYAVNASKSRWGTSYSPGLPRTFQFGIAYQFSGKQK